MKPYTILHMLVSVDGKITGEFLGTELAALHAEDYYRIHRQYQADAFACGRVTMEGSFTHGKLPEAADVVAERKDFVAKKADFYAVAIDPHGRLGWESADISDEDPGYDKAHVIEVLTEQASDGYIAFLKAKGISYIFCGDKCVDVNLMMEKLSGLFGIEKLLLEGGGLTDTLFLEADCIDEVSLVVTPLIDGDPQGKPLFSEKSHGFAAFSEAHAVALGNGGIWLNYKK